MARAKYDGVIEAVRYTANGKIDFVRAYKRHGATFSDHILLRRGELLEQLKKGQRFVTGQRKEYLGSTFETGKTVKWSSHNGDGVILTDGQTSRHDFLESVPIL
jgi:hypothetical protein